ncbi:MAG: TonB-dependent receptor, partial [Cytophagales bacterium]|nr:TonB-dependent receptor [Cytophagales bacterium]
IGTVTDEKGDFTLNNVPLGRQTLKITMLGYAERTIPNIVVSQGKETILNIDIEEQVIQGQEVVVTDKQDKTATNNEMVSVSARQFSREEASRYAGAFNDPARMASNYAGVSNGNDGRNDIIIRGNSPLGLLWRLEGMPIPNPNHFGAQGTTGGPVSMLNYNQLANSDFLTGAFPAEYGNATSGVFDLKMRNGNNEKHEFVAQIGFNGLEAGAEGPFSKKYKGNFMINYRYSTLGIFQLLGVNFGTGTAVPLYQDLGFKVDLPTTKFGRFQVFGLGGISNIDYLNSKLDTSANATNSYGFTGFDTYYKTRMGLSGITHVYFFNPSTSIKTGLVFSYNDVNTVQDSIVNTTKASIPYFRALTSESRTVLSSAINKKFSAKSTLNVGFYFHNIGFNYDQKIFQSRFGGLINLTNSSGSAQLLELFAQWQYRFTNRLTVNPGLHFQYFLYNNTYSLEPRLGARYSLLPNLSLNAGLGMHSQLQPLLVYFQETRLDNGSYT